MKVWIITSEYNDYDQHGSYFEEAYANKPSYQQVEQFLVDRGEVFKGRHCGDYVEKRVHHLLDGGGRIDSEHVWYTLEEVGAK